MSILVVENSLAGTLLTVAQWLRPLVGVIKLMTAADAGHISGLDRAGEDGSRRMAEIGRPRSKKSIVKAGLGFGGVGRMIILFGSLGGRWQHVSGWLRYDEGRLLAANARSFHTPGPSSDARVSV